MALVWFDIWYWPGRGTGQMVFYTHTHTLHIYRQSLLCMGETLGWKKHKLESRLPGEISITSDMQMTPPLWKKAKRNWRASWWKWKRKLKKTSLKLNVQKLKIMASGPITTWKMERETMETVTDFIFLGSKITADGDCSNEIKRHLLLRRKAMANLDSILKSRNITFQISI